MKRSSWSPADLHRQEQVVRRIALRAEVDRRQLHTAWQRWVEQLWGLGAPLAVVGCFFAGVVIGSPGARRNTKATPSGDEPRRAFLPALFKGVALSALTSFRWYAAHKSATAQAGSRSAQPEESEHESRA
jgi:hypothetical protein